MLHATHLLVQPPPHKTHISVRKVKMGKTRMMVELKISFEREVEKMGFVRISIKNYMWYLCVCHRPGPGRPDCG